jgi:hypothetical protein
LDQTILNSEKLHLAELLEAIQRCVYFLDASSSKLTWPLTADLLETQKKDVVQFEVMAAINILPKQIDFTTEFMLIVKIKQTDESRMPQ